MSQQEEDDKELEKLRNRLAQTAETERISQENKQKRVLIDQKRLASQHLQLERDERDSEIAKNINFGAMSQQQIEEIQKASREYIEAAKGRMRFVHKIFDKKIPFFRKNLILIGAKTGHGKSTAAANIAYANVKQVNPLTGKLCKTLFITNEECKEDFYNRVTSLINGWHYTDQAAFTEEQINEFDKNIALLGSKGSLVVIDNNFGGMHGATTTLEGIRRIFDNLIENKIYYDTIVLDYFQNVVSSTENPHLDHYQVLQKLSTMLDQYKNEYPAPIVVFAQIKPDSSADAYFQEKIKNCKMIMDKSTVAIEIAVDYAKHLTEWTIWKNRFNSSTVGTPLRTGYDNGKYVEYTDDFQAKIAKEKNDAIAHETDKQIDKTNGIKDAFKKDENGSK